jgi:hypothetical protein
MPTSTVETKERPQNVPVVFVALRWIRVVLFFRPPRQNAKSPANAGFDWSEREDLNLRPLVSQTEFCEFWRTV